MKKMIMTMAIAISSLAAFAADGEVSQKVLDAFKSEFSSASQVTWTISDNYYKAAFTYNDKYVFAYYDAAGELLAISRYITADDLPLVLSNTLKKNYAEYWISDLFEVAKTDGTSYFITLENSDSKLILKSSGSSWTMHQKLRKS